MTINDKDYNEARKILKKAGSKTADKAHDKHTKGIGSKEKFGYALLDEAREEFRKMDKGQDKLVNGMTKAHDAAHKKAKKKMGL